MEVQHDVPDGVGGGQVQRELEWDVVHLVLVGHVVRGQTKGARIVQQLGRTDQHKGKTLQHTFGLELLVADGVRSVYG